MHIHLRIHIYTQIHQNSMYMKYVAICIHVHTDTCIYMPYIELICVPVYFNKYHIHNTCLRLAKSKNFSEHVMLQ